MHYTDEMIVFARNWFVQGYFVAWVVFGVLCGIRIVLRQRKRRRDTSHSVPS